MVDDDVVAFADGLPAIPEKLLLARDRGEVLFITGAGISRPAPSSLPDFRELVVEVYDRLDTALAAKLHTILGEEESARAAGEVPRTSWTDHTAGLNAAQQAELRAFTDDEFDVVLGMLERRLDAGAGNASSMRKAVSEILARTQRTNDLHVSLARLGQRFGRPFIATTNFDPPWAQLRCAGGYLQRSMRWVRCHVRAGERNSRASSTCTARCRAAISHPIWY
jgi:hypothetical protein